MSGKIYWHFHFLSRNLLCCTIKKSSQHLNFFRKFNYFFYDYHSNSISVVPQPETIPDIQKESGLGMVDYLAVIEAVATSSKEKTRKTTYIHWSNKYRFTIGKYSAKNGHAATVRRFSSKEKSLKESTVRRFCKHYKGELKQ